jgi:hypothetical protein
VKMLVGLCFIAIGASRTIALVFSKEHTDQIACMSCPGFLTLYVAFDPHLVVGTTAAAFTRRVLKHVFG